MRVARKIEVSDNEVLEYIKNSGTIDITHIQTLIMTKKEKEYLDMHPWKISNLKNGKWSTYLPLDDGKRKKVVKNTQKEIEQVVIDFYQDKNRNPTIGELFVKWNAERLEYGMISGRSYDRYNSVFKRHFSDMSQMQINDVTIDSILKFLMIEKRDKELSRKSFNLLKSALIGIIETADDNKLLPFDFLRFQADLRRLTKRMRFIEKIKDDEDEVFDEEEYEKIVMHLRNNADTKNVALLLMFVTGMRIGELVAIKNECVLDDCIKVCRSETRYYDPESGRYVYDVQEHPKTSKGFRRVVLPPDYNFLLKKLKLLNPFGEYVFTDETGKRLTVNCISRRLKRVCKELNLKPRSAHKVRKTVGTIYFDAKVDQKFILDQMGWSNVAVGEVHYHRNRKSVERKWQMLGAISEFNF